jgi:hypothetical protein
MKLMIVWTHWTLPETYPWELSIRSNDAVEAPAARLLGESVRGTPVRAHLFPCWRKRPQAYSGVISREIPLHFAFALIALHREPERSPTPLYFPLRFLFL